LSSVPSPILRKHFAKKCGNSIKQCVNGIEKYTSKRNDYIWKKSMNLMEYRKKPIEQQRINDIINIIPRGYSSVLDVGARYGYISKLLTSYFDHVIALDLEKPRFHIKKVTPIEGDITHLEFPDNCFDVVVCTEVLEHIPSVFLRHACDEIARVAKYNIVIGVPYQQDICLGRTTCASCAKKNPPWAHVNSFSEEQLKRLFENINHISTNFVGTKREKTNALSVLLMDLAGNPWGTYAQEEACIHCGKKLIPFSHRSIFQKVCSRFALILNDIQNHLVSPSPIWMHMVFKKEG